MFIILPEAYILLYILGSNFFSCSAHSVPPTSNKQTIEEISLAVNQLAILHLLNGEVTGTECERMSRLDSEEKEELRNLREEVATLRQTQATLRDNMREEFNNSVDMLETKVRHLHTNLLKNVSENQDLIEDLRQSLSSLETKNVQLEGIVSLISNNNVSENCSRQCDDDPEAEGNQTTLRVNYEILRAELDEGHFFHHEGETFFLNREEKMTWFEGRKWCQARGGELAHPSGNLRTFLNKDTSLVWRYWSAWIGASYSSESEQWQWVTGLSIQGDLPWLPDRPNTPLTRYNCLAVSFGGSESYFFNGPCNNRYNVICQF
ncbi:hypothetical protein Pcinc_038194 [Petrolisthes cinctipes]|uniref:C-type lectin domain-containing protein n=1 Tax=Petrolisthes cinctipes TaxID=88211 RepID=A0AAE1EKM7_PETCI|nr:hypothetical protein Pcinc_038194 [Petrolisthes cinctipes]